MRIRLPQYTTRDYSVMFWVTVPFICIVNSVIFGSRFFSEWKVFVVAATVGWGGICIDFILCGFVAVALKKRLPAEWQVTKRLTLMILVFWLFTVLFLYTLFRLYEKIDLLDYTFSERAFVWSCIGLGIINVFLTFLMEGVARYDSWKESMEETEKLSKAYTQSRLLGLKSQVNPHFLFNSLNSLSSLISEDGEAAEKFLDEMSNIDFDAALTEKNGKQLFVNPDYERKSNRWKMAFRAGKEVIEPARIFVQQWADEIK